ncbi:6-bladed beta-propeller [Sulfuritalea sp.]|uniref:6-bladed beta-propeller n=1 Tax=Sulfuritalea sp. TaxID=2480090 RepID=UPI00286DE893|nr:6-bladed beta-propeller [Sulfuritalea sp.]
MKSSFSRLGGSILMLATLSSLSGCVAIDKRDMSQVGRAAKELVFPLPPDEPRFVFERTIRGSADVTPETDEGALRRALTGVASVENQPLVKPYAVAVYRGKVLVTDSAARMVRVFDVPGQRHYQIGDADVENTVLKPLGVDVDRSGIVYVADATRNQIMVFDIEGKFLRRIGDPKMFKRLSSVTVSPDGSRIYVVDIGGVDSDQHRVRIFDTRNGQHLFDIGKRGSNPGEFNLPRDVAIGKDGRIYVVDGGNFRVQIFDKDGKFIKTFGQAGKQLGDFARPKEVAVDSIGNVYVADSAFGNFQVFNADGELLMFVGDRSEKDVPAGYMLPSGITVDENDRVYFVDQWFSRVDVFRPYAMKPTDGFLGSAKKAK